jgi:hypothetical protein
MPMECHAESANSTSAHPCAVEHLAGEVHAYGSDHAWLAAQEAVVEQRNLHEELGERAGLDVVVVGL